MRILPPDLLCIPACTDFVTYKTEIWLGGFSQQLCSAELQVVSAPETYKTTKGNL